MINLKDALTSPIGKKVINGLSAIGAVVFVIAHLGGNLSIFGGEGALHAYAEKLHHLFGGIALPFLEAGLIGVFVLHIASAIAVTIENKKARSQDYEASRQTKGGPSNWGFASNKMIISGLILLVFMIIHLLQFRLRYLWDAAYSSEDYYHNLWSMLQVTFAGPNGLIWTIFYCGVMVFLGFHMRHGVWSMFQSIGAMKTSWKKPVSAIALILAVLVAVGFFVLPIYMFATMAPPA